MHRKWIGIVGLLALFAAPPAAHAQAAAAVPAVEADVVEAPAASPVDSAAAQAAETPAGEQADAEGEQESPRMQRLKALTYDRRPSTILRTWAEMDRRDADADEESKEQSPAEEGAEESAEEVSEEERQAQAEAQALEEELQTLQRNVTLGRWEEVKAYFAGLPEDEAKAGYTQMLRSLGSPPTAAGGQPQPQVSLPGVGLLGEQHTFSLDDVIAVADACPFELDDETVTLLGPIVRLAMQAGVHKDALVERLHEETQKPDEAAVLTNLQAARLLVAAGHVAEIEPFLPSAEEAIEQGDAESLMLLAQTLQVQHSREGTPELLERTWNALQAVLGMEDAEQEQRDQALAQLVALVPKVRDDLGQVWLEETFRDDPERGMRILAVTGASSATGLQSNMHNPQQRLVDLRLQKTAVESLLEIAPERAAEWTETIRLLAFAWLKEAEVSRMFDQSTSSGPRMQRDPFGNLYYVHDGMQQVNMGGDQNMPRPIRSAELLEEVPGEEWLAQLDETARPQFFAAQARLHLKVSEDEEAYPYIERLAETQPDLARDLVHEFIRVWTRNHDPNASQRYTSTNMYIYGFERRANSIPLTRSKQERNIAELTRWVRRIRELPIEDLDESLFAKAFTTCHSSAEVYRLEAIEEVFGSLEDLEPEMIAQLVQQMRQNLAGIWRMPATQEEQKTQRKQKDIEAEVMRGYAVAHAVVEDALQEHPDNWRLRLARASIMLDENSYRNEIAPSSEFSERRLAALEEFQRAAELYAETVPTLKENEQQTTAYEHWFYAGLGASDLTQIDHRSTPDPRQPALIREAILSLPGEAAEKHMEMFANTLFTRMSSLDPTMKFTYLDAGFEIVGDAEQAEEARRVYDYYQDLVTEIELVARVDGSARVGHEEPFGVFVELLHTREIERESGGFAKYLQNQGNLYYAWNYGRPLENYRDKFEEGVRGALEEHFDVLSVTFQEQDVHSRAAEEYGWRITPYAYLLLQPRGPQVDKLPSLKIDLDFLDTSGYVVLPITSSPVPIDAAPEDPDPRPYDKLQLTQTLDERQAGEGKLVLEVKAVAQGLVPPLEELVDLRTSDFEVTDVEDQGVMISKFDPESGEPAVISERLWMVSYAGRTDLAELPTTFHFPEPTVDAAEVSYLRYDDADMAEVEPIVSLEREYGEVRVMWPWYAAAALLLLVALLLGWRAWAKRRSAAEEDRFELPETLTPFNVLALLRDIERNNGFDASTREELATHIESVERHYFAGSNGDAHPPDLRSIAEKWLTHPRGRISPASSRT